MILHVLTWNLLLNSMAYIKHLFQNIQTSLFYSMTISLNLISECIKTLVSWLTYLQKFNFSIMVFSKVSINTPFQHFECFYVKLNLKVEFVGQHFMYFLFDCYWQFAQNLAPMYTSIYRNSMFPISLITLGNMLWKHER